MTDTVSREKRSEIMRAVRSTQNRSTELQLVKILRKNRISGWRRGCHLFGKPDFVFRKEKVVIFVDGCFWHGCKTCRRNMKPSTNSDYWLAKIARNKARGRKVNAVLRRAGWRIIRIWEHEVSKVPDKIIRLIQKTLVRGKNEKETGHLQPRD